MITLDALTLPDDLVWTDEFTWSAVQQSRNYSLTGALIVETGIKQAGRPITLGSGRYRVWIQRSDLEALYAKLDDANAMTLTLHDGRSFNVRWRHDDTPIDAEAVQGLSDVGVNDFYYLTLRFLTV